MPEPTESQIRNFTAYGCFKGDRYVAFFDGDPLYVVGTNQDWEEMQASRARVGQGPLYLIESDDANRKALLEMELGNVDDFASYLGKKVKS